MHDDGIERKVPPDGYLCLRCKTPGHYLNECPLQTSKASGSKKTGRDEAVNADDKSRTLCNFFLKGACLKGDSCPFSHDLSLEPCRFYHLHRAGESL